jgi:hypothetical protein
VKAVYGFCVGLAIAFPLGVYWGEVWVRRQLRGKVRVLGYERGEGYEWE